MQSGPIFAAAVALSALLWAGCGVTPAVKSVPDYTAPTPAQIDGIEKDLFAVVEIVSKPGDAMVVVNRQPLGVTPQQLKLPVTVQGFVAEPLTIAVRFVARDAGEASLTKSVTLQMTDRVPAQLAFERENVRRIFSD